MSVVVESMKALAKKLTAATASLQDGIADYRGRIEAKQLEIREAIGRRIPRNEVRQRIGEHVRRVGEHWITTEAGALLYGDRSLATPDLVGDPRLPWSWRDPMPWGAFCAAAPELAGQFLETLVGRVPYKEGAPASERPALIARLTAELAALEADEEALIDNANAAGVVIAHRPAVVERRQREADAQARQERMVADRRARQNAIEQHYQQTAGGARSQYIESRGEKR